MKIAKLVNETLFRNTKKFTTVEFLEAAIISNMFGNKSPEFLYFTKRGKVKSRKINGNANIYLWIPENILPLCPYFVRMVGLPEKQRLLKKFKHNELFVNQYMENPQLRLYKVVFSDFISGLAGRLCDEAHLSQRIETVEEMADVTHEKIMTDSTYTIADVAEYYALICDKKDRPIINLQMNW